MNQTFNRRNTKITNRRNTKRKNRRNTKIKNRKNRRNTKRTNIKNRKGGEGGVKRPIDNVVNPLHIKKPQLDKPFIKVVTQPQQQLIVFFMRDIMIPNELLSKKKDYFKKRMLLYFNKTAVAVDSVAVDSSFDILKGKGNSLSCELLFVLYNELPSYYDFLNINIITDNNQQHYHKITSLFEDNDVNSSDDYSSAPEENAPSDGLYFGPLTLQDNALEDESENESEKLMSENGPGNESGNGTGNGSGNESGNDSGNDSGNESGNESESNFVSLNSPAPAPAGDARCPHPNSLDLLMYDNFDYYDILWNIILNNWKLYYLFLDLYMYQNLLEIIKQINKKSTQNNLKDLLFAYSENIPINLIDVPEDHPDHHALIEIINIELKEIKKSIDSIFKELIGFYLQLNGKNYEMKKKEAQGILNVNVIEIIVQKNAYEYIQFLFIIDNESGKTFGSFIYEKYREILLTILEY